ncbi:hypothetical protein E2C01_061628 [Portunus trituberculatus]|uniref:Uncharacterized protein n=1 Tax=Portunus trituberculatus TaxID=210409 RepID=A0A5B7H8N7_PORTR|nr:hypothetical protein [Portunus trituberculatus]
MDIKINRTTQRRPFSAHIGEQHYYNSAQHGVMLLDDPDHLSISSCGEMMVGRHSETNQHYTLRRRERHTATM